MVVMFVAFLVVVAVMVSASISDFRTREILDYHWIVIGAVGITVALLTYDLLPGALLAAGYGMFMLFMFSGRVEGKVSGIVIVTGSALLIASSYVSESLFPMATLAMTLLFLAMYFLKMMKGGADVKALVVLSFVFPAYPEFGTLIWEAVYPSGYVFNPVFSSFAIAVVLSTVYAIAVNYRRSGGERISSYVTTREDAEGSFVWKLQEVDGDHVRVTPMIPFLVPLTAGLLISVILGSPFFLLI